MDTRDMLDLDELDMRIGPTGILWTAGEAQRLLALARAGRRLAEALGGVEWMPVYDPDTNAVLGQLCLFCHRKPHTLDCRRQLALAAWREADGG